MSKAQGVNVLAVVAWLLLAAGGVVVITSIVVGQERAGSGEFLAGLAAFLTPIAWSLAYFPLFLAAAIVGNLAVRRPDRATLAAGLALGISASLAVLSACPLVLLVIFAFSGAT